MIVIVCFWFCFSEHGNRASELFGSREVGGLHTPMSREYVGTVE